MANVVIWVHCVWGTKSRFPFITDGNRRDILWHICQNAEKKGIVIDFINAHKDHVHCLISMNPEHSVATIVKLLKGESSHWINRNLPIQGHFEWADEYYAASVSYSIVDRVREYIKNQDLHHQSKTWQAEESEFKLMTNSALQSGETGMRRWGGDDRCGGRQVWRR